MLANFYSNLDNTKNKMKKEMKPKDEEEIIS